MSSRVRSAAVALAALAFALAPAAGQSDSGQPAATRVAQALDASTSFWASKANPDSAFLRGQSPEAWDLGSTVAANYGLTFYAPGVSGRALLSASAQAPEDFSFALNQCWVRATLAEGWGVKFGRFDLNWKDGGRWNPSDVVNNKALWGSDATVPGRDALEILGSIPLPGFALDLNLATAIVDELHGFGDIPAYAAVGGIVYPFEFRLKAAMPPGAFAGTARPLFGASAKVSLASLNAYADALLLFEDPLSEGLGASAADSSWIAEADGRGCWSRWCLGASYAWGFPSPALKTLSVGAEYLRQDDGLSRGAGNAYFAGLRSADLSSAAGAAAFALDAARWGGRFFSLYRDYLFLKASFGGIARQDADLDIYGVANLDDGSIAIRAAAAYRPKGLFSVTLSAMAYLGPEGSEARELPLSATYALGLSKSF